MTYHKLQDKMPDLVTTECSIGGKKMARARMTNTFDKHMDIPDTINKKYIQEYMSKYGTERTSGFIDALNLLTSHLDYVSTELISHVDTPFYIKASPANTRTNLILFKESLKSVLKNHRDTEIQKNQQLNKSYSHD